MKITKKIFDKIPQGETFAVGLIPNHPDGAFLVRKDQGRLLRWVVVKGYNNDWTLYCSWMNRSSIQTVQSGGDKMITEKYIRRCIDVSDEVFKLYRN